MVVVVEPGARSARTADAIRRLANDIGIKRIFVVLNKVDPAELEQISALLAGYEIIGSLPYSAEVRKADLDEAPPYDRAPLYVDAVRGVVREIRERVQVEEA
jgi:CO dehydrogenase maturation factor